MIAYAALALLAAGFYGILLGQGAKLFPAALRKKPVVVAGGIIAVLAGVYSSYLSAYPPGSAPEKLPTAAEIVEAMKKKAPVPRLIDETARLDGLMGKGSTITYAVTLFDDQKVPAGSRADALVRALRKKACANEEYKTFFRLGIGVEIRYADEKGRSLGTAAITPQDCGY